MTTAPARPPGRAAPAAGPTPRRRPDSRTGRLRDISPAVAAARARVGSLSAAGAGPEQIAAARADLAAANCQAAIERFLGAGPAAGHRAALAALLLREPA